MKQLIFAVAILMSMQLSAQRVQLSKRNEGGRFHKTAFGAISTQYSRFDGNAAIFSGVYGGLKVKRNLMVGIGGYGLVTRHKGYGLNAATHQQNNFRMGYGGLMAEYTFFENRRIHLTANTLVGGGLIKNGHGRGTHVDNGSDELRDIDASGFYVVQPSVNIEYTVTSWCQVAAGGGYRYITGSDQEGITDKKMSAPTAGLAVKFGVF